MPITINARPNLNGNTQEDFGEAYTALTDAMKAIDLASSKLNSNVLHGRNYQHLLNANLEPFPADEAIIDDRRAAQRQLDEARAALGVLASAVVDAYMK